MRVLVVGAPPVYLKLLAPLPEDIIITSTADSAHPFVQVIATSLADMGCCCSCPFFGRHEGGSCSPREIPAWSLQSAERQGRGAHVNNIHVFDSVHRKLKCRPARRVRY